MPYDKNIHHRRSIRLPGYDYSAEGQYFITICAADKKCIFGHIRNGEMILNDWGRVVHQQIINIPTHCDRATIHEFIVMPNHLHMIIGLNDTTPVRAHYCAPTNVDDAGEGAIMRPYTAPERTRFGGKLSTLAHVLRGFKSAVSKQIGKPVWQRNYYEHIIRDGDDYQKIATYVVGNPRTWDSDNLYQKQLREFVDKFA